jgi:hypothetical protein
MQAFADRFALIFQSRTEGLMLEKQLFLTSNTTYQGPFFSVE